MTTATQPTPETALTPAPEGKASKFVITLNHFKHALRVVSATNPTRSTVPILQGVRIEQLPAGLAIETTDLDTYTRALVPESGGPTTPLVIPADKLTAWVKLLEGEDVKISTTTARATMTCGRSRAVLPVLSAATWPASDVYGLEGDSLTLKQGDMERALRFAMIAVSHEASRYVLNGVLLLGDGKTLRLVATNGHCMMIHALPCAVKLSLLLPSAFIKAVMPWLAEDEATVNIRYSDTSILAAIAAETPVFVASKKLAGQFPNWEAVLPSERRIEVTVDAKTLLGALTRCALLSDERSSLVIFNFGEHIVLTSASAENGESQETVDYINGTPKEPLCIGLNSEYVINLLKRLDGEVRIALPKDGNTAILFKDTPHAGETLDYVVMPMRA